jgi:hypothetical protein
MKPLHPLKHPVTGKPLNINLYAETDVRKTFERVRAEQKQQAEAAITVPKTMRRVK